MIVPEGQTDFFRFGLDGTRTSHHGLRSDPSNAPKPDQTDAVLIPHPTALLHHEILPQRSPGIGSATACGHAELTTTQLYADMAASSLKAAIATFSVGGDSTAGAV